MLIGCDLAQLDDFTLGLLTNDEVIDVDQDPLGLQATQITVDGAKIIYAKELADGSFAVGLFNVGETPSTIVLKWKDYGESRRLYGVLAVVCLRVCRVWIPVRNICHGFVSRVVLD